MLSWQTPNSYPDIYQQLRKTVMYQQSGTNLGLCHIPPNRWR